ncbi:NAM7-nonsense-mediated mRNA decay [Fusarium beomiforme]|uniref:NAM7-nonsense-mediated mRNA decay n=1 Tax=Fusarium beomiforme TaxID=44412 RepID=A0A9P5A7C3_9HYPO|nr:NAM7-nonsense-mediated mRNA decay [Fusarium beomiforme]
MMSKNRQMGKRHYGHQGREHRDGGSDTLQHCIVEYNPASILECTTTGLTKYRGLIAALKPNILMIEEAAETREANIRFALYPSLDQIDSSEIISNCKPDLSSALYPSLGQIVVGDHRQLCCLCLSLKPLANTMPYIHVLAAKSQDGQDSIINSALYPSLDQTVFVGDYQLPRDPFPPV